MDWWEVSSREAEEARYKLPLKSLLELLLIKAATRM